MKTEHRSWRQVCAASGFLSLFGAALVLVTVATRGSGASIFKFWRSRQGGDAHACGKPESPAEGIQVTGEPGGTWYWLRSPEEEQRVIMGLYNRYCIRCHGVDGRGVWDIPDVPDFTNARWQASRSDGQIVRAILEGRGAVMPPFRGTLTLEEAWAMSHYLRTFVPGTEVSRPDVRQPEKPAAIPQPPAPKKLEEPSK